MHTPSLLRTVSISSRLCLIHLSPRVWAAGAAWEPFAAFSPSASGRTDALAIYHGGTLYALGGRPYRCPGAGGCTDPEPGAADYLPAGGTEWLQGQPFDDMLQRLSGAVDGSERPVAFGGSQGDDPQGTDRTFIYDIVFGDQTEPNLARRNYLHTNFAWAVDDRGRLYAIGGGAGADANSTSPNSKDVERYDSGSDAIAATSMGALVGGAYASGVGVDKLESELTSVDWDDLFVDEPPRGEWPVRPAGSVEGYQTPTADRERLTTTRSWISVVGPTGYFDRRQASDNP